MFRASSTGSSQNLLLIFATYGPPKAEFFRRIPPFAAEFFTSIPPLGETVFQEHSPV